MLVVEGANGSGKSTLLRMLAGVLTPSAGSIALEINGHTAKREEHPLQVGLVAPYLNLYDAFTPRENLAFITRARRMPNAEDAIDEMLSIVQLTDRADDPLSVFSSGMKQRVKYAAALLVKPKLLLLDEPGVNLDAAGMEMVDRVIRYQLDHERMLVIATNDEQEAARFERRIRIEDFR